MPLITNIITITLSLTSNVIVIILTCKMYNYLRLNNILTDYDKSSLPDLDKADLDKMFKEILSITDTIKS